LSKGFGRTEAEASKHRERVTQTLKEKLGQELHEAVDDTGAMQSEIVFSSENQ
jgi:hypothetical protein